MPVELDYVRDLRQLVEAAHRALRTLPEPEARQPVSPGKWSPCEIIGHLIDSASNNHQRFVRAQFTEDLVFPGYEQVAWVRVQRYSDAPWAELLDLWRSFNRHLARVMEAAPAETRLRERRSHNLHELAWKPVAEQDPATLDDFMRDYVDHLQHHLRQIPGSGIR